jgi:transposase
MATTIKDIAEETGVSYATVSRALNNKYGVPVPGKRSWPWRLLAVIRPTA